MLTTNHAIAGALVAVAVKNPAAAIPLAFVSHYAMDMLPHFGMAVIGGNVRARNNHPLYKAVTSIDIVLCIGAVIVVPFLLNAQVSWLTVLACMLAAVSPDFAWVYKFFKELKSGIMTRKGAFNQFHKSIQWAERPYALVVDILWFVGSLLIVGRSLS
ncbi:MAG: hypothetical protein JWO35_380 [Candidatus Saccharibacteria bacterium]|nr:hypothetical protein [Candidatus Saccharibacteria bacterium]